MTDRPVLFASYSGLLGGAERVLLDCATRLDRPLQVACPPGPLADALGTAHVPLKPRPLRTRPHHLFGLGLELSRLARDHVLVAWGARAVIAAALMPRGAALAVHHDLYPSPALRGAVRACTRRAGRTMAASQAIADQLPGEVAVLHPGVDLEKFTPTPLPPGPPKALVVGALVAWKRPDLALTIAERMPDLHITFAGEPLPGETFDTRPRDRVHFAGRVEDVNAALADAHLLLHCADAEPYGLALVEALAAGRPVVAPDAAGPREIVTTGAGRLYPPGDADAAVEAIAAVLADPGNPREHAVDVRDSVRRLEHALP